MYNRISLGSDHAGFELKEQIKSYLNTITNHKLEINDWGCYSEDRVDYPRVYLQIFYMILCTSF